MMLVLLYGELGRRFGRVHRFDIRTPAEAVRALSANHKGFRAHLIAHSEPGYRVLASGQAVGAAGLHDPAGGGKIVAVRADVRSQNHTRDPTAPRAHSITWRTVRLSSSAARAGSAGNSATSTTAFPAASRCFAATASFTSSNDFGTRSSPT